MERRRTKEADFQTVEEKAMCYTSVYTSRRHMAVSIYLYSRPLVSSLAHQKHECTNILSRY